MIQNINIFWDTTLSTTFLSYELKCCVSKSWIISWMSFDLNALMNLSLDKEFHWNCFGRSFSSIPVIFGKELFVGGEMLNQPFTGEWSMNGVGWQTVKLSTRSYISLLVIMQSTVLTPLFPWKVIFQRESEGAYSFILSWP